MKFKLFFPFFMTISCFSANANYVDFFILRNTKITTIEVALNEAKSIEEIKAVSNIIFELIFEKYNDTCPAPKKINYQALCADIGSNSKVPESEREYYEYSYEKRLLLLACVDVKVDDFETTKKKMQLFWNKYKTNFSCDSVTFGVQNGNILKFALSQNRPQVIETIAAYGCDINFIDPADGLNLLDYVTSEITRLKLLENSKNSVSVYESYKSSIIGMGGKSNK